MERKVIVIAGPTCSGKTTVSLKIAADLNTEIISADSRQVYKYLDIGTAKPTKEILNRIKHHFVDMLLPDEPFDANVYEIEAGKIINHMHGQNKIPVVQGGSGLYIKALIDGLYDTADKDENYRELLGKERVLYGNEYLYAKLLKVDPESASKMIPQNWKRVMRALEVFHLTGRSILSHQKEFVRKNKPDFHQYGLNWKRELLYERINLRVEEMIASGLEEETKNILGMGYPDSLNALNTVGYKEMISYFKGEYDFKKAVELIKRNTRRYAKRQLTWFRKDKRIQWLEMNELTEIERIRGIICNSIKEFSQ